MNVAAGCQPTGETDQLIHSMSVDRRVDKHTKKKAIILDLDNTLYSAHSIGEELFTLLFNLIEDGNHTQEMDKIKDDISTLKQFLKIFFQTMAFPELMDAGMEDRFCWIDKKYALDN